MGRGEKSETARIPDRYADLLRRDYAKLPRAGRWSTAEGQEFLKYLEPAVCRFGPAQLASVLQVTPQALQYMRSKRRPNRDVGIGAHEVRELRRAWKAVEARRQAARQVRRTSTEFRAVHVAAAWLLDKYDLADVVLASGIPCDKLRPFLARPPVPAKLANDLHQLRELYESAARDDRNVLLVRERTVRIFFQRLDVLARLASPEELAECLSMPSIRLEALRGWYAKSRRARQ